MLSGLTSHHDNKKLHEICQKFQGREGECREMIEQLCDQIRNEFPKWNCMVLSVEQMGQFNCDDVQAEDRCEFNCKDRGMRTFECRVFGKGTLEMNNLKGNADDCACWACFEMEGDRCVFTKPKNEHDRKRLDMGMQRPGQTPRHMDF